MKKLVVLSLIPLLATPLFAQGNTSLSYEDRVTCGALLFLSSQAADNHSTEQQFAAHHLTKAIEMSGKEQAEVVAYTERRMEELTPAWESEDAAVMQTYNNCIMTVFNEVGG